eukprot:5801724-Amphidinium_carterae.1
MREMLYLQLPKNGAREAGHQQSLGFLLGPLVRPLERNQGVALAVHPLSAFVGLHWAFWPGVWLWACSPA